MKIKIITLITILGLLSACTADFEINSEYVNENKFTTFLRGYWGSREFHIAGSDIGIYSVDHGQLSFFDFKAMKNIRLSQLTYQDDKLVSECRAIEKYCMAYDGDFISFYDGYLYFVSFYSNIEGGTSAYLTRVKEDGSGYERLLSLDDSGYYNVLIKGKYFYVNSENQRITMLDVNTNQSFNIEIDNNEDFISFVSDGNNIIMNNFTDSEDFSLWKFNFETNEFESLDLYVDGLSDIYHDKLLTSVLNDDGSFFTRVIDFDDNVIVEIKDDDRFMNYIDDQYIYTISLQSPQKYIIYDYDGNIVEEYTAPDRFIIDEDERFFTAGNYLELTQIQGFNDDYLFVIGMTKDGLTYVLIDRASGEWIDIEI